MTPQAHRRVITVINGDQARLLLAAFTKPRVARKPAR
jgi:hypothetical protein